MIHKHLLCRAIVDRSFSIGEASSTLDQFLRECVDLVNARILIEPQVALSDANAWTGIVGISTSHIAFHYWPEFRLLQLDLYSCREFSVAQITDLIQRFWDVRHAEFILVDRSGKLDVSVQTG